MSNAEKVIQDFLSKYAEHVMSGDADGIAAAYFSTYIEASPSSIQVWAVDGEFKDALKTKTSAMRNDLGLSKLAISLQSIRRIAPSHYLADAQWSMTFSQGDRRNVTSQFVISYVIRHVDSSPVILAYISHEDEEQVLQRDGII